MGLVSMARSKAKKIRRAKQTRNPSQPARTAQPARAVGKRNMTIHRVERELTAIRQLIRVGKGTEQFHLLERLTDATNRLIDLERSLARPLAVH